MPPNYRARYEDLMQAVLDQARRDFLLNFPSFTSSVTLTNLTEDAIHLADTLLPQRDRQIGWDWRTARDSYRRNHVERIELAIWHEEQLCGLMLGKASRGRLVVKINFLQGGGSDSPLKGYVLPIATRCAELYAAALNAEWVGVQDPLDSDELIEYYRTIGFVEDDPFDPRNNALFKRVIL